MFKTITDLKRANAALGHFFFSPDTMQFFASKIESKLYGGRFFITSEVMDKRKGLRVYKIREANAEGSIRTAMGAIADLETARTHARALARNRVCSRCGWAHVLQVCHPQQLEGVRVAPAHAVEVWHASMRPTD